MTKEEDPSEDFFCDTFSHQHRVDTLGILAWGVEDPWI